MSHRTKYAITYRVECVRDGIMKVRDLTFKVWADSGKDAIKALYHERGISRDHISAVYEMKNGERTKIM